MIRLPSFLFKNYNAVFVLYGILVIAMSVQILLLSKIQLEPNGPWYTKYGNYVIFKQSYFHLIHQQDLYAWYLKEQWDLFKYSPAFALFFGLFAYLPDAVGLTLWNLLNAFCIAIAIRQLPLLDSRAKISILLFIFIELSISLQNVQSNALVAGLLILAFVRLEKGHYFLAALFITLTVFIKIFGVLAFVLFLFYPGKGKLMAYTAVCFATMALLPWVIISFDQLKFLYTSWFHLLLNDHSAPMYLSVMGWLTTWFHLTIDKNQVILTGLMIFTLPFLRWNRYDERSFRLLMLCSILLWIVIFNHRAESPTFIIAMAGVGIWYFAKSRNTVDLLLATMAFIFTSLSRTDIFPLGIQKDFFDAYSIKVVPCILVWGKLIIDTLLEKKEIAHEV